jgi:exodeoxyribonuclease VII large subunit
MASQEAISLFELNARIRTVLDTGIPEPVWITAEISDITFNRNGHCYLELIEKEPSEGKILARTRATIWSTTLRILRPYFEQTTGRDLGPGIKVMVRVTVDFHEVYSISLNIRDIEPTFTIGELARQRQLIIRKLEEAGVFDMNKTLEMPLVPQRVAIITSATAAGYEDFENQIRQNTGGFVFYLKLFQAVMQGEETVPSIIDALDRISHYREFFDVVVIIRGGGSKLDLSSFDSYDLAYYVTQFPLPVITGIGHEQDDTILDLVAHTRCKTPTAAAEFLIDRVDEFYQALAALADETAEAARNLLSEQQERISVNMNWLRLNARNFKEQKIMTLDLFRQRIAKSSELFLKLSRQEVIRMEQFSLLSDPAILLKRGYSLTYRNGTLIRNSNQLKPGDRITTRYHEGQSESVIDNVNPK